MSHSLFHVSRPRCRYSAFGNNRTTAVDLLRDSSSHRHLCYLVFDVLWVKGWTPPRRLIELDLVPNGNITSWKLENRKRVLHALVHKVCSSFPTLVLVYYCTSQIMVDKEVETVFSYVVLIFVFCLRIL